METFSGLTPQYALWSSLKTHDCPERARNTLVAGIRAVKPSYKFIIMCSNSSIFCRVFPLRILRVTLPLWDVSFSFSCSAFDVTTIAACVFCDVLASLVIIAVKHRVISLLHRPHVSLLRLIESLQGLQGYQTRRRSLFLPKKEKGSCCCRRNWSCWSG
ncbi:hypothetical protein INR49_005326 [Caranx melampygus]|nr:hypothetical protein INR49_005326 [Caranx melampygus]